MKTTYMALHQGHAYRTTRSRPVGFAIFWHNEYSLLIDELRGWAKTERGAQQIVSRMRGNGVIVPARVEEVVAS